MSKIKDWTGERLETFVFNETTIEHLHRYAIAMEFCSGKTVLDIACGEGYGSNLLSAKATHVTGMDADAITIEKATAKYKRDNLYFVQSKAEKIAAADTEFDIVVSLETLEHLSDHTAMMKEIKRVMKPGGLLIISTPDKKEYTDKRMYKNPFHIKELYRNEFEELLKSTFIHVQIFTQQMTHSSFINVAESEGINIYSGDFTAIKRNHYADSQFLIALASDNGLPILSNSLFNGNSIVEQALIEKEKMVMNTITYRLGHFILYPFKLIRDILKK
ncbi:MAG: class I SAM-dependent methyltransferase [Chitinophagaceae bacterium]|jgi:2-polyprenyl-3-methyl-5-hydroxy-6-metoxy-1,4-benzoquinol methylase|nr:class I SAM-dependent methyltransferase [Chitinophagaceae bacterium]MBK7679344.1 class I SAM-dependent methyltransferase [Chitinophagaceae bacterium]MBK8299313.1 class I SAM-dependent methyltransferase [Chitinophagaceae bacterium]MBK9463363.1 class I SAM-dependent methyltransferase [Chitinophagaceae bacterium]MBK9661273.1 class I SAM-dependent methyltransferase [Chitinophagaceae bacterium]